MNASVFGSLQNLKDNKSKPVRDEYEYVSDEGELKIDEFPIRRKKNSRRDQSCEYLEPCQSGSPYRFFIYFNGNPDDNPVVHLAVDGFIMNIFTDFFIFSFLRRQRAHSANKESKVSTFGDQGMYHINQ